METANDGGAAVLAELYARPGFQLRRAHQIALSVFADECGALDVTPTQFGVMTALDRCTGADQITVARLLGLDRSTTGLVLSLLEDRGVLVRETHPTDRRKRTLTLTAAGQDLLAAATPLAHRAMERVVQPFTTAEAHAFVGLLARLVAHFSPTLDPALADCAGRLEELYARPGYLIRRAHQIAVAVFEEECRPLDLTTTQFGMSVALHACPGVDQITLSRLLGLDRSNVGLVVSLLEGRGVIAREAHPEDRRKRVLALTDDGRTLLAEAMPMARSARERLLEPFMEGEALALSSLLERLLAHHNTDVRVPLTPGGTLAA